MPACRRAFFPQAPHDTGGCPARDAIWPGRQRPSLGALSEGRAWVKSKTKTFPVKHDGTTGNESKLAPADARAPGLRWLLRALELSVHSGFLISC